MNAGKNCPHRAKLTAFSHGDLPLDEMDRIAEHLDTCVACETIVEATEAEDDGLLKLAMAQKQDSRYDLEVEQQQAIEAARLIGSSAEADHKHYRPAEDRLLGTQLGQYELLAVVGHGGMGTVYRARHRMLGRIVAVKILAGHRMQDPRAVARFLREMRAIGKLDHPNIVRATDANHQDATYYLVMDYVEGRDLGQILRRVGTPSIADACELVRQAALGLQYTHEHSMVHRDIKPSNLLVDSNGQVRILDLGLSLLAEDALESSGALTATGSLMGTYDYMSPEQCDNSHDVTIQSDLYSLGCTLYEVLSGRPPFGGPEYATAARKISGHLHATPAGLPSLRRDVPGPLVAIVGRLLSKTPGERFATPAELATALEPLAEGADLKALCHRAGVAPESLKDTNGNAQEQTDEHLSSHDVSTHVGRSADPNKDARPQPISTAPPRRRAPWKTIIAIAGLAGIVVLAVTLTLQTERGTLLVQIDDPAVEAKVTEEGLTIKEINTGRTYRVEPGQTRLPTGQYGLTIRDDAGLAVDTSEFTLQHGEKVTVRVTLRKPETLPAAADVQPVARPPITPQKVEQKPLAIAAGEPLASHALVVEPARIQGVRSWTIEPRSIRTAICDMAFSPDGRMLAAVGPFSGTVRAWNAENGALLRVLVNHRYTQHVYCGSGRCLAWSPDSKFLAVGEQDGTQIWEVASGLEPRAFDIRDTKSVVWSPDGRTLAIGGHPGVALVDLASGKLMQKLVIHKDAGVWTWRMAWSPNGETLATGQNDGHVTLWNPNSGVSKHAFDAKDCVWGMAWSPNGSVLAVTTEKRTYLLDGTTATQLKTQTEPSPGGRFIVWIDDGKTLFCTGRGFLAWTGDGRTGAVLKRCRFPRSGNALLCACSSDFGKLAVAGGFGALWLWKPPIAAFEDDSEARAQVLSPHVGNWGTLLISNDGSVMGLGGESQNPVSLWETDTGKLIGQFNVTRCCSLSPDGTRLVGQTWDDNRKAIIYDVRSLAIVGSISTGVIRYMRWSPDGRRIGVGTDQGAEVVDAATAKRVAVMQNSAPGVFVFSPDGKMLASAANQQVRLYNPEKGNMVRTINTKAARFGSLAFSPDGKTIAGVVGTTLYLFDVESGELINRCQGDFKAWRLCWYDGGKKLRCGANRYWDTESRALVQDLQTVDRLSARRDISVQTVGLGGNVVRVRRLSTGRPLYTVVLLPNGQSATISPEGHFTGTSGVEKELVYVVQTDAGQLTFTPDEFAKKYGWKNDPTKVKAIED